MKIRLKYNPGYKKAKTNVKIFKKRLANTIKRTPESNINKLP